MTGKQKTFVERESTVRAVKSERYFVFLLPFPPYFVFDIVENMPKRKAAASSSSASPNKIAKTDGSSASNDDFCTQLRQLVHEGGDNAQIEQLIASFHPPQPQVQGQAPEFRSLALMPNKEFTEISLSDYKGKWVVFFWYPLDFTFVCPTEIIAFGDRQDEFSAINAQVIAASCDSHFTHLAWVNTPRSEGE